MTQRISTQNKMWLLGSLYLSQGLPFGFFTQALPVLMRKQGYSLEVIGLTSMLALPWALKFIWAPLVDQNGSNKVGRRRSWIIPLQFITIIILFCVAMIRTQADLTPILFAVFIINLLAATQDIATDGLAVDILSTSERGIGNGIQVAGYRVGMIIGGGVMLIIYDYISWFGTFATMGLIIGLATIPILRHREQPAYKKEVTTKPNLDIITFFKRPGMMQVVFLIVVYKTGDAFATSMLRPFLTDMGLDLSDIGWLLGTVGFISGLAGAVTGGALVNKLGRKTALVYFAALQAITVAGYAFIASGFDSKAFLYLLCGAEHMAGGMATAALFTCMMDWCRKESSATDYTIQASLVVIATGVATLLSGFSAGYFGYSGHFMAATVISFLSVGAVIALFPSEKNQQTFLRIREEGAL